MELLPRSQPFTPVFDALPRALPRADAATVVSLDECVLRRRVTAPSAAEIFKHRFGAAVHVEFFVDGAQVSADGFEADA